MIAMVSDAHLPEDHRMRTYLGGPLMELFTGGLLVILDTDRRFSKKCCGPARFNPNSCGSKQHVCICEQVNTAVAQISSSAGVFAFQTHRRECHNRDWCSFGEAAQELVCPGSRPNQALPEHSVRHFER